ncbi:hypothetical protein [Dongshaea marina]|uniref:hypothetical protein n=1 Tax=Dongshaea marina TaxID=2047966 RepID=UPI00131ED535|nr:hypothetical protein [Dongshaea marina]
MTSLNVLQVTIISFISLLLISCGGEDSESRDDLEFSNHTGYAISGSAFGDSLESIDNSNMIDFDELVVFDEKNKDGSRETPRFGIVKRRDNIATIEPIEQLYVSWIEGEPRGNDLEAICRLSDSYYLAIESSYYKGLYGRMFLLERDLAPGGLSSGLQLKAIYRIPAVTDASFEGLACAKSSDDDGTYNILLGERESGDLYWGKIDPIHSDSTFPKDYKNISYEKVGKIDIKSSWSSNRKVSDLFFDPYFNQLYGTSSYDPDGKPGASAHSTLYQSRSSFHLGSDVFMKNLANTYADKGEGDIATEQVLQFPTHKVEAITGFYQSGMFYGSDDDNENNIVGMVRIH